MSLQRRRRSDQPTKAEKLFVLLSDHRWHTTRELSRRVGHAFAVAIYRLRHEPRYHYDIERQRHPTKPFQHQYRLIDPPNG